jgi:hypothetical protein
MLVEIKSNVDQREDFSIALDGRLLFRGRICVPDHAETKEKILEEAHKSRYTIHPGATKMYQDLKRNFWWPNMKREVAEFIARCLTCQQVKAEHLRPAGKLKPLEIPEWKWDSIGMDFIMGLPKTRGGLDGIWVIIDRLTKSAHFLPIKSKWSVDILAALYIKEIVRLHGIPVSIISDRDPRFTSHFWKGLQHSLGTRLNFSTAFHPQTDGQTERANQIVEDMLRACIIDFGGSWHEHLPLIEFAYNNSYQASIQMAPFEALYGRSCRSPICWNEVGEKQLLGPELVRDTTETVKIIRERLAVAQNRQKVYADNRRRELEFQVGDHVFLKVSPGRGIRRFGIKGKLSPRFIGPFEILERVGEVSYRLALPPQLVGVHDVFHISMLKKYVHDPFHIISHDNLVLRDDLTYEDKPIKILDQEVRQLRNKVIPMVKVQWSGRLEQEATWETEETIRKRFPELFAGKL